MNNVYFEAFMTRLTLREHLFAVYLLDTCLGEVSAVDVPNALAKARLKFKIERDAPIYLERVD